MSQLSKFAFPKVFRPLAFSEFRPEYPSEPLRLWVNVPRALFDEYRAIAGLLGEIAAAEGQERLERMEAVSARWVSWLGGVLFDPASDESLGAEEISRLADYCVDQDPQLWQWLMIRVIQEMVDWRRGEKKESSGRQRASSSAEAPAMTDYEGSGPPAGSTSSSEGPS